MGSVVRVLTTFCTACRPAMNLIFGDGEVHARLICSFFYKKLSLLRAVNKANNSHVKAALRLWKAKSIGDKFKLSKPEKMKSQSSSQYSQIHSQTIRRLISQVVHGG